MLNKRHLLPFWPPLVASLILLAVVIQATTRSIDLNDGVFVYGLDDAYIHMSIARNFVQHGVWGITEFAFSSTTSSPLWTFGLAVIYFLTGVHDITPLLLNILAGIGLLLAVHHVLRRHSVPAVYSLALLLAIIILLPLTTLILSGMEHVLHILLAVLFVHYAAELTGRDPAPALDSPELLRLCLLGALLGASRYEGLFLVLIFCGLLALRLRLAQAVLLGALSVAPVVIYGLVAIANGWEFLPASLTTKSDTAYLAQASFRALVTYFIEDTYHILARQHVMLNLMLGALFVYLFRYEKRRAPADPALLMLVAFVLITLVNVRLVSWPWAGTFSRYEAYLIVLGLVAIPAALGEYLPRTLARKHIPAYAITAALAMFVLYDVYDRYTFIAYENPVVTATRDIYQQQYQMALFLAEYYDGETVAANDIGAINYFARIDNIDLWGLGTVEVARSRSQHLYGTAEIRRITAERGGKIAMLYEPWFDGFGGLPEEWELVGRWTLDRPPVILGHETVSFYAIDPEAADELARNLAAFASRLPAGVIVSGLDDDDHAS
jgi:hypothetical protein